MALRRNLILSPLAGLLLLAVLFISYFDAPDACTGALWTGGWFFVPPLLALPGFFAASPSRAGSIVAALALMCLWSVALLVWFVSAIACGAG